MTLRFCSLNHCNTAIMPEIVSKTVVGSSPSHWYGTLVTSDINYEDGSRITVQNKLYVTFLALTNTKIQLNSLLDPRQEIKCTIEAETVDDQTVGITAEIHIDGPYTFKTMDTLTREIACDLAGDALDTLIHLSFMWMNCPAARLRARSWLSRMVHMCAV